MSDESQISNLESPLASPVTLFYIVTFERSGAVRYFVEFRDDSRPICKPSRDDAQPHDLATATAFMNQLKSMNVRAALEPVTE